MLGSPIAHSLSPRLHAAAYGVLGLSWSYEAIEITAADLPDFITSTDDGWRGLSLTMPLKRDILPLLDSRDETVELTGGANTVLFSAAGTRGFNTDVYGIEKALARAGRITTVRLLGAGATAASALVAVARLGAEEVHISARSPEKAAGLRELGELSGMTVTAGTFEDAGDAVPDVVISTLPGGATVSAHFSDDVLTHSTLFDVAYDPWPSVLASRWFTSGGRVVPGIEMLVHQALAQVRIFATGNPDIALENEAGVFDAMRASVGLWGAASDS